MSLFSKKNKTVDASLPEAVVLHGIEIKKVPIGRFITNSHVLENLPQLIIDGLFPGSDAQGIMDYFTTMDIDGLITLAVRAIAVIPEVLVAVCEILGIDHEKALELGLTELTDVLIAYWELNDYSSFFKTVGRLKAGVTNPQNTGSKNGSQ